MKYRSDDCLASILSGLCHKPTACDKFPVPTVIQRLRLYQNSVDMSGVQASPDNDAVYFYALNQCVAVIAKNYDQHAKLPPELIDVVKLYRDEVQSQSERLLYYMLMITTRESRHTFTVGTVHQEVASKFGQAAKEFNSYIHGSSSTMAVERLMSNPPKMNLGPYVRSLEYFFRHGKFSSSYGGLPWANIAFTLAEAIDGNTSLEMMTDTAYTLAHNNGPMFNKGMLYCNYTSLFAKVLDVQRSGQVVELVKESPSLCPRTDVKDAIGATRKAFPKEFGEYVDWYKVEALGSLKKYPNEKQKQALKYGEPLQGPFKDMMAIGKVAIFPDVEVTLMKRIHGKKD